MTVTPDSLNGLRYRNDPVRFGSNIGPGMADGMEAPVALRVGLVGQLDGVGAAPVLDLLGQIHALLAGKDGPALLRLVVLDPADPSLTAAAAAAGWSVHQVAGLSRNAVAPGALVLDGDPANPGPAQDAAARTVIRNCDLLAALGDARSTPLESHVRQALGLGVPVWWLAPGQPSRLLLERGWHLVPGLAPGLAPGSAPEGDAAWASLRAALQAMLRRPDAGGPPLGAQLKDRRLWHAHQAVLNLLWRPSVAGATVIAAPSPPYWAPLQAAADRLANGYADRYRSSYTVVLGLAALALMAAVLGLALGEHGGFWTAAPEVLALLGIVAIVQLNTRLDWRRRLILCRLLAELCRKQGALGLLGRSLPVSRIARMTDEGELGWVGWRFAAAVRAAPLPSGVLAGASLDAARDAAAAVLLGGQHTYHAARIEAGERRERRLVQLGTWAFYVTAACVVVKLVLLAPYPGAAEDFGLVAALLPAFAAALFGFRAYAELELMVQQSERMLGVLGAARRSLDRTDTGRPLASQHVGDVLEDAAAAMLADVEGWVHVSRVKAVEAG